MLEILARSHTPEEFLERALASIAAQMTAPSLAVLVAADGQWSIVAATGSRRRFADNLCSEALDREAIAWQGDAFAIPLGQRNHVLTGSITGGGGAKIDALLEDTARDLGAGLRIASARALESRHIERMRTMLAITAQWNRSQSTTELLEQMAEASTRLLGAERASIFLWDRANHVLVARPALGVEGGELRLPDNLGVVGKVIQSGEAHRVDQRAPRSGTPDEINRAVDKQLAFHTRNLVCVPLRSSSGELLGAFELINKLDGDFTAQDEDELTELAAHAAVALENSREREQLVKVRDQLADEAIQGAQLVGDCPAIVALRSTIQRVAETDLSVLVLGENGTGKEVVAKRIHFLSQRRNEPFVAVNCAALAESLLESELFGHEKGAFTDAHTARAGKFELASGGTLLLDEIGDMSLSGQAKLLRVLEEKVVVRVGGSTPIHTDARVIAATNQNLAELVRARKFREDLFFRLNVVTLELPPLRARDEDLMTLAEFFLEQFCQKARRKPPRFTAAARERMLSHSWPGNVRELRNLMERIAFLSPGNQIEAGELNFILSPSRQGTADEPAFLAADMPLAEATRQFQAEYIKRTVRRARGNMTEAAERLGLHRSNLYRKLRQLGEDAASLDDLLNPAGPPPE
jgi:Nif-specific regulatory protein